MVDPREEEVVLNARNGLRCGVVICNMCCCCEGLLELGVVIVGIMLLVLLVLLLIDVVLLRVRKNVMGC